MVQLLPMILSGDNLGQRHQYLNARVNQAAIDSIVFQDVEEQPEQAPADRLFKIDLANKLQQADYILKTIKNDDMLYVSRALKCKWLLARRDIINPNYLENVLYPEMVMPAISKMKNWLYINLRDPISCQEFYEFYKTTKFQYAVKFLKQCNNDFLLNEFPQIVTKVTPHYLKLLGQKCPQLVKIYYDAMVTNNDLIKIYIEKEQLFYNNIMFLLKLEPDLFLDIVEKYHNLTLGKRLSPWATKYILRFHKSRFMSKPELYVVHLLHIRSIAQCLSEEECQEVVIKLARAEYLKSWFSYENCAVELLVKRLSPVKRDAFNKRVFVEKDVGENVADWPYTLPTSPVALDVNSVTCDVSDDCDFEPIRIRIRMKKKLNTRRHMPYCNKIVSEETSAESELQKLFNEFRFEGFEGALYELEKRIRETIEADRRRDMLLVLVNKSRGSTEAVRILLELALNKQNEPALVRATIVCSLVKEASVWRLPQDVWDTMLIYARGLGLDGTIPEAECCEGLHAAVMRQLIVTGNCERTLRDAFLNDFSTFTEYKLDKIEREKIGIGLQNILVAAASEAEVEQAADYLYYLFDVLEKYDIPLESSPAMAAVIALAERDIEASRPFLKQLYDAQIDRHKLLRQYLKTQRDDAALLNALRHDVAAVTPQWLVQLISNGETRANKFLLKLSVYFTEKGGLAEEIRQLLLEKIAQEPDINSARSLATLAGGDMCKIIRDLDVTVGEHSRVAAVLRANMHHARPAPNALVLGWRKVGMKAIAYRAMRCPPAQVMQVTRSLLEENAKQTVRLALTLAQRTASAADIFARAIKIRPLAAMRASLLYFRDLGEKADRRIWDLVKPLISDVDLRSRQGLRHILSNVDYMPRDIKPDYCAILYLALDKTYSAEEAAHNVLKYLMKLLPEVNNNLLESVILRMLEKMNNDGPELLPAIFIRYLMLSENDNDLNVRFKKFGEPFLKELDLIRDGRYPSNCLLFSDAYDQLISSLKYNFAFFNIKYKCCLAVMERVLTWMETFLSEEEYLEDSVKIHTTMTYFKSVRQSMEQEPESRI